MSGSQYSWSENGSPARLLDHSKAKHDVYREYLRRYVRELTKDIRISKLSINVVDGFCGGGVYLPERGSELVYGSPVIFLEVMREMQAEVQSVGPRLSTLTIACILSTSRPRRWSPSAG